MATVAQLEPQTQTDDEPVGGTFTADSLAVGLAFFAALSILQRLIGFARSLIFCHLMTDDELGRWSLSFSFLMMAAPLAVLGLPGSFGRYYEFYRQRGQVHAFLRKVLTLTAVLTVVSVVAVFSFPQPISQILLGTAEHAVLIRSLAVALTLIVALNVALSLATSMRQVRMVSIVQFVHSVLFAIVACVLLETTTLADQGAIIGYSAAAAVALGISVWLLWQRLRDVPADSQALDRSLWSRLVPFAAWVWVSNALFNLFDTIDRLMIVHFAHADVSTDALVGQYHSSRIVPILLVAVSGMLAGVILPYLSEDWERGERSKASATTVLTIKVCSLLFVTCGALLLLMAPLLFETLLQGRYHAGMQVLPGTLVYCIWFGLTILTENHLLCAERAKWITLALLLGLLINVLLNAVLLPWFGLLGAVTATAAANAVTLYVTMWFARAYGLQVDRQVWIIITLPLVLLLGWQTTIVALLILGVFIYRGNAIFCHEERHKIALTSSRIAERLCYR